MKRKARLSTQSKLSKNIQYESLEEITEIISSQLMEADIERETVKDIITKNINMSRDYDKDEHIDQVILNHKIAAVIEIVILDKGYVESKTVSTQGHKKIMNVLKTKH
jgi:signal recognition particle GTPase